jgi:hypothetical protein
MSFWEIFFSIIDGVFISTLGATIITAIIVVIYNIYHKSGEMKKQAYRAIFIVVAILAFAWYGATQWYGNRQIGSIFERRNYQNELYYVHLYLEDEESKNYKVVAEIDRIDGKYYPQKVYFNARQYLVIDYFYDDCKPGDKISFKDRNDREWRLELTSQRAEKIPD